MRHLSGITDQGSGISPQGLERVLARARHFLPAQIDARYSPRHGDVSSGLRSRTMKSALLPAATGAETVEAKHGGRRCRVAATIACAGVRPAATMCSSSTCSVHPNSPPALAPPTSVPSAMPHAGGVELRDVPRQPGPIPRARRRAHPAFRPATKSASRATSSGDTAPIRADSSSHARPASSRWPASARTASARRRRSAAL